MALSSLAREVLKVRITPLSPQNLQTIEQYVKLVDQRKIVGDFVECGMNLGGSAILLATLLSERRRFRGYDIDLPDERAADRQDEIATNFAKFGLLIDGQKIALHRTAIGHRLPLDANRLIALAHVNCEWPDTGRFYLSSVAPQMASGGFILIEERNDPAQCRSAANQFLDEHANFAFESSTRGSTVLQCLRNEYGRYLN